MEVAWKLIWWKRYTMSEHAVDLQAILELVRRKWLVDKFLSGWRKPTKHIFDNITFAWKQVGLTECNSKVSETNFKNGHWERCTLQYPALKSARKNFQNANLYCRTSNTVVLESLVSAVILARKRDPRVKNWWDSLSQCIRKYLVRIKKSCLLILNIVCDNRASIT